MICPMLPWLLCAVLAAGLIAACVRLALLRKSLGELADGLSARLSEDTNNPVFLSSRDKYARRLAARINDELHELRRQRLEHESGNRELKQAVTDVSHDLRTPLTAVSGYLELLQKREADKDADTSRYLALIDERVRAMTALTEELLIYTSAGGGRELRCEPVDLVAAVEQSAAAFYAAFTARGIEPVIELPECRVTRPLDKAALARVLENLFSNALKYSGGDLAVTLTQSGVITFRNSAPDLDEVRVGRLFDRFFTVNTARAPGGLGLSIAKTLVERMGGAIGASYQAGSLTVTLRFDAASADNKADNKKIQKI